MTIEVTENKYDFDLVSGKRSDDKASDAITGITQVAAPSPLERNHFAPGFSCLFTPKNTITLAVTPCTAYSRWRLDAFVLLVLQIIFLSGLEYLFGHQSPDEIVY